VIFQDFDLAKKRQIRGVAKARFSRPAEPSRRSVTTVDECDFFIGEDTTLRFSGVWMNTRADRIARRGLGSLLWLSARSCRRLARRQEKFIVRLISRNWRLKSRQRGGPEFNAVEIGMKPMRRLHQVPHDEIFRAIRHRS